MAVVEVNVRSIEHYDDLGPDDLFIVIVHGLRAVGHHLNPIGGSVVARWDAKPLP